MQCPKCGENALHFVVTTDADFEAVTAFEGGFKVGGVMLDGKSFARVNESRSEDANNIELHCRACHSSFEAKFLGGDRYDVGDEIW